jgi:large subunit ribosomal protein L10
MAKTLKRMIVQSYERDLGDARGVILLETGPLTVERNREFRRDLREKAGGARLRVIHNRTARRALGRLWAGRESDLDAILSGPSAMVFGGAGPGPIAKVLRDWRRKLKTLRVKGGVADGEVLDGKGVDLLADLPDLPQIRAMLLTAILGPARGVAAALQAAYGGIARATQARVEKSPQTPDPGAPEANG